MQRVPREQEKPSLLTGGPAELAGLKPGDIVIAFENREITTASELIVAVRAKKVGDTITLAYIRGGKEFSATLTLIAAPG